MSKDIRNIKLGSEKCFTNTEIKLENNEIKNCIEIKTPETIKESKTSFRTGEIIVKEEVHITDCLDDVTENGLEFSWKCNLCSKAFKSSAEIGQHLKKCVKKPDTVNESKKSFRTGEIIVKEELHIADCLDDVENELEIPWKCNLCNKAFKSFAEIGQHLKTCGKKPGTVNESKKSFKTGGIIVKEEMHITDCLDDIIENGLEFSWKCNLCSKAFKSSVEIGEHLKTCVRKSDAVNESKKSFKTGEIIVKEEVHITDCLDDVVENGLEIPWKCNLCSKAFKSSVEIGQHLKKCVTKPDTVNESKKSFKTGEIIVKEEVYIPDCLDDVENELEIPWKCNLCNKAFKSFFELDQHLKTCVKKPDMVNESKKRFRTGEMFVKEEVHITDCLDDCFEENELEIPSKCNLCNKAFKSFVELGQHLKTCVKKLETVNESKKRFRTGKIIVEAEVNITDCLDDFSEENELEIPSKCNLCNKEFKLFVELGQHLKTCVKKPETVHESKKRFRTGKIIVEAEVNMTDCLDDFSEENVLEIPSKCNLCNKEFKSFVELGQHLKTCVKKPDTVDKPKKSSRTGEMIVEEEVHIKDSSNDFFEENDLKIPSKCNLCNRAFKSFVDLAQHLKTCVKKPETVNESKKRFRTGEIIVEAEVNITDCLDDFSEENELEIPSKCNLCNKEFKSFVELGQHLKTCVKKPDTVNKSKKISRTGEIIVEEEVNITDCLDDFFEENELIPWKCNLCNKPFKSFVELDQHLKTCVKKSDTVNESKNIFKTGKTIQEETHVTDYLDDFFEEEEFLEIPCECNLCNRAFKSFLELTQHLITCVANLEEKWQSKCNLNQQNVKNSEESPFECDICEKKFKSKKTLRGHAVTHSDNRPFKCSTCDKAYKSNYELNRHNVTHSDEKPYNCDVCDKQFKLKDMLNRHAAMHIDELPFKCNICEKRFKLNLYLKRHTARHSEEKPFKCDICDKNFKIKDKLYRHKKIHSTERPFKCNICDKKFQTKDKLNRHNVTHSEKRPFKCNLCEKQFKTKKLLHSHNGYMHTVDGPFKCDTCKKQFKLRFLLNRHAITHSKNLLKH